MSLGNFQEGRGVVKEKKEKEGAKLELVQSGGEAGKGIASGLRGVEGVGTVGQKTF